MLLALADALPSEAFSSGIWTDPGSAGAFFLQRGALFFLRTCGTMGSTTFLMRRMGGEDPRLSTAVCFAAMSGGVDSAAAALLLQQAGCRRHRRDAAAAPLQGPAGPVRLGGRHRDGPGRGRRPGDPPCGAGPLPELFRETQVMDRFVPGRIRHGAARRTPASTATGRSSSAPCWTGPWTRGRTPSPPATTPGCGRIRLRPLAAAAGRGPAEGPDLFSLPADPAPAGPSAACRRGTMRSRRSGLWRRPTACPTPRRRTARTSASCRTGTTCPSCGSTAARNSDPRRFCG